MAAPSTPHDLIDRIAATADEQGLPLVAAVTVDGELVASVERGDADRRCSVPNTVDTVFGVASVTKAVTALVVMSLVDEGLLALDAPARRWLGDDLPLIDDEVTIDHLLVHRSGIGDYLDETAIDDDNDYVMAVPVHRLATTESYLAVLDGHQQVSIPGAEFAYNNGAFVVLALIAQRAAGVSYRQLASDRVFAPAGMGSSEFHRTDELPAGVAAGYLEQSGLRTNMLHLPVLGVGDGGLYTTVADLDRLWRAFFAGSIVPSSLVDVMVEVVTPSSPDGPYGRGFWLVEGSSAARLIGGDTGISVVSVHDRSTRTTATVVSNMTSGAWPVVGCLDAIVTR